MRLRAVCLKIRNCGARAKVREARAARSSFLSDRQVSIEMMETRAIYEMGKRLGKYYDRGKREKIRNKGKDCSGAVGSYLLVTSHLFLIGLNTTVLGNR